MESQFSKQSDLYARYRPDYPDELFDFIFSHLIKYKTAWDCCTGTGQVAKVLSGQFEKVYANDISQEQLSRAPDLSNVYYYKEAAEETGFPSAQFDLITVAQAIHWLDFDKFYEEVKRTAAEGALLAVIGYGMVRIDEKINPLIDEFYEYTFSEFFTENREYLDKHYATIPFPFKEIDSPEFVKKEEWSLDNLEGYLNSWSTVQKFKDSKGYNPADELIANVKEQWKRGEGKKVTFPVFLRLGSI
ncbi:MAG: class I SAM-dependent methyltransferase [Candidatus Halalkalibacterium sp. M3_1C_030]